MQGKPTSPLPGADWNDGMLRMLATHRRYLIGVSGGRDSVTLLHWLLARGYRNLTLCHLNHRLRSNASDTDESFVEKLAKANDLNIEIGRTDVRALAAKRKQSIETAGRFARHEFFAKIARRLRCHTIFLAHHADDLVETFLMNLFRGAGTTGLAAMRAVSEQRCGPTSLTIARPLLGVWREEIDRYVSRYRLRFREDQTNRNLTPLRNRLRRRIIPYLEKTVGRNIRESIWRAATIAAEEEEFFKTLLPDQPFDRRILGVESLRQAPIAVQRRILRQWLDNANVSDLGFDLIERVRALLDLAGRIAKTNLPRNRHVRRRAGQIFIE